MVIAGTGINKIIWLLLIILSWNEWNPLNGQVKEIYSKPKTKCTKHSCKNYSLAEL